jgi:hypothetical protein
LLSVELNQCVQDRRLQLTVFKRSWPGAEYGIRGDRVGMWHPGRTVDLDAAEYVNQHCS